MRTILSPTSQVGSFLLSRNIKNLFLKTLAYPQGNSGNDSETYQRISIKKSEHKIKKQSGKPEIHLQAHGKEFGRKVSHQ